MAQDFGFGSIAGDSLASMIGSMEQMRKMWSGIGVPGSLAPTVDPKELERRIADLRVVEQWLKVNLHMLKSTIQALELQHGALAAMHSIGESMAAAMPDMAKTRPEATKGAPHDERAEPDAATARSSPEEAPPPAGPAAPFQADPAAWWDLLQAQFNQIAQVATGGLDGPVAAASTAPSRDAGPGSGVADASRSKQAPGPNQASGAKRAARSKRRTPPARTATKTGFDPGLESGKQASAPQGRKRGAK